MIDNPHHQNQTVQDRWCRCSKESGWYDCFCQPVQRRGGIRAASEPAMFLLTGISNLLIIVTLFYDISSHAASCTFESSDVNQGATDGSFCLVNVSNTAGKDYFCCNPESFSGLSGGFLIGSVVLTFLFIIIWLAWITAKLVHCCNPKKKNSRRSNDETDDD